MLLILIILLNTGCEEKGKVIDEVEVNKQNDQLQIYKDKIVETNDLHLRTIRYFQIEIKKQFANSELKQEVIWLQIDKNTTDLSEEKLKSYISKKLDIPKEFMVVQLVDDKKDYEPPYIYTKEELEKYILQINNSEDKFLTGIEYFKISIKKEILPEINQKEVIWLQVDEKSTLLKAEEIELLIESKLRIPKQVLKVEIVEREMEFVPVMEPW